MLSSLKNKFKKERKPLCDIEEVKKYKEKFGAAGRGRKRRLDCESLDDTEEPAPKHIRTGVSSCINL